jgi:cation:H+ antiporter
MAHKQSVKLKKINFKNNMHEISSYGLAFVSLGAIGFGIYLLVLGGDWAVSSSIWIAEKAGLTKLFIGATIIAFGTSAPELVTSLNANFKGYPGISLGNIIGSNIANILLVLGVSATIAPVVFNRKAVRVDVIVMIFATAMLMAGIYLKIFAPVYGAIMFLSIIIYVIYQYYQSKVSEGDEEFEETDVKNSKEAAYKLILGFGALILGSEILVQGAIAGGMALRIPEAVIGLTVIALGTSLPELGACVAAAKKNQTDIIIGGIVGSNIFNILSIIGITSMVKTLPVVDAFKAFDIITLIAATGVLTLILLFGNKIGKILGFVFVATYTAFIIKQFAI